MPTILIVCTANICRSPVAEALLRRQLTALPIEAESWTVVSAGTLALIGRPPALYSQEMMREHGLEVGDKRAQMITSGLMQQADLVLCMEAGHAEALRVEFPADATKVYLLSEMVGLKYSISDPYGGPREGYAAMFRELSRLLDEGLPRIVALARAQAARRS